MHLGRTWPHTSSASSGWQSARAKCKMLDGMAFNTPASAFGQAFSHPCRWPEGPLRIRAQSMAVYGLSVLIHSGQCPCPKDPLVEYRGVGSLAAVGFAAAASCSMLPLYFILAAATHICQTPSALRMQQFAALTGEPQRKFLQEPEQLVMGALSEWHLRGPVQQTCGE